MFVVIFPATKDSKETQFRLSAGETENLIKSEFIDKYTSRSNGSQRQLNITTVAGNSFSIIEPACQSLALDLLKSGQHK